MRVAVLGTGLMGSAMAERLSATGHEVLLWNRTREKAERLANAIGAKLFQSPWKASEGADITVAFVADDKALLSIASEFRRADGLVFINSSTTTPMTSEYVANYMYNLGICYLEAPVIGGANDIRQGKALFLVSGDEGCARRASGLLSSAGEAYYVSNKPGTALALKLAYNALLITTVGVLSEALALSEAYGVSWNQLLDVLNRTAFAAVGQRYLPRVVDPSSPTHFRLALAAKDLEYASRAAFETNVSLNIVGAAARLFKHADAAGLGDLDYTRVIDFVRPRRASSH